MRLEMRSALVAVLLLAGTAHAAMPRVGWELSMARTSLAHGEDLGVFEGEGRWLPRVAVVSTFDVHRRFKVSPSVAWVERGAASSAERATSSEAQTFRERYLAFGVRASRPVYSRLSLAAGAELAWLLKGEVTGSQTERSSPTPQTFPYRVDYTSTVSRVDLLGGLGLEVDLPAGNHSFVLLGRYQVGVLKRRRADGFYTTSQRNIAWTSVDPPMSTTDSRTQAAEFGLGFRW